MNRKGRNNFKNTDKWTTSENTANSLSHWINFEIAKKVSKNI